MTSKMATTTKAAAEKEHSPPQHPPPQQPAASASFLDSCPTRRFTWDELVAILRPSATSASSFSSRSSSPQRPGQECDSATTITDAFPGSRHTDASTNTSTNQYNVSESDLARLRRGREDQLIYDAYMDNVRARYDSVKDFILHTKFDAPMMQCPWSGKLKLKDHNNNNNINNGVAASAASLTASSSSSSAAFASGHDNVEAFGSPDATTIKNDNGPGRETIQQRLVRNDYPYYFELDVEHWILWKWAGNSSTVDGARTKVTSADLEAAKEELQRQATEAYMHQGNINDDCSRQASSIVLDFLHWDNPPSLKSVPEIDHVHILCRRRRRQTTKDEDKG